MATAASVELQFQNDIFVQEFEEMREELQNQIAQTNELIIYKEKYEDLVLDYNDINKEYDALIKKEAKSNLELRQLRKETEELSSELFGEANKMVSYERKKNHKLNEMNKCLKNEINEQKVIIKMYEHQLQSLKDTVCEMEKESEQLKSHIEQMASASAQASPLADSASSVGYDDLLDYVPKRFRNDTTNKMLLANVLYTPTIQALRHDLKFYSSFVDYVYANQLLLNTKSQPDYKDAYFFKRLVVEDIDPTLNLESSPVLSFFQKKNLYNAIYGQAIRIEPFFNVNDRNVRKASFNSLVGDQGSSSGACMLMSKKCCAMCGEDRNDTLEHARLYTLKVVASKKSSPSLTSRMFMNTADPVTAANADLPLCTYCLSRVRSVCNLFGFLNSVKLGMYMVSKENKASSKRLYLELNRFRSKLFWSRVGVVQADSLFIENPAFTDKQLNFQYQFNQLAFSPQLSLGSRMSSPAISAASRMSSPYMDTSPLTGSYVSSVSCSPMSLANNKVQVSMSPMSPSLNSDSDAEFINDFKMVSTDSNKQSAPSLLRFDLKVEEGSVENETATKQLEEPAQINKKEAGTVEEIFADHKEQVVEEEKKEETISTNEAKFVAPPSPLADNDASEVAPSSPSIEEELRAHVSPILARIASTTGSPKGSGDAPDVESVLSEQEDQANLNEMADVLDVASYDEECEPKNVFEPIENFDFEKKSVAPKEDTAQKKETSDFKNVKVESVEEPKDAIKVKGDAAEAVDENRVHAEAVDENRVQNEEVLFN